MLLAICVLAALAAGSQPGFASHVDSVNCDHTTHYDPTDPDDMFDPPVRMTVFGTPYEDIAFTFKLTSTDPLCPMPEGSEDGVKTIKITGSGVASFGTWSYTEPGAHFYTVYVVNENEIGYKYDTAVYTITDVVKAEDGALTLNRVITNKAKKQVTAMNFMNRYSAGLRDYSSSGFDGSAIVETKTESGNSNNFYYFLITLGAILAVAAAGDLIIGYLRPNFKVRFRI
jgi:pilin isopeptide linkage protein